MAKKNDPVHSQPLKGRGGPRPGSGRPKQENKVDKATTTSVRISTSLAKFAKLIADERKISVTEYLHGLLVENIVRDFNLVARKTLDSFAKPPETSEDIL